MGVKAICLIHFGSHRRKALKLILQHLYDFNIRKATLLLIYQDSVESFALPTGIFLQQHGSSTSTAVAHRGWDRAVHCQAPSSTSAGAVQGHTRPAPSTPPGTLRRMSQHRRRKKMRQGACQNIGCLHLLFQQWPMWDLPRLRHNHQTSFSSLRTLLFLSPWH